MHSVNFTKICELIRENEVVHYFENEQFDKMKIITKKAEDFEKDKKYKIIIQKEN